MTSHTLDHHLPIIHRQKLSAAGLVLTTALLLVMAGVAAGSDRDAPRKSTRMAELHPADIKAEALFKSLGDTAPDTTIP